MLGVFLRDGRKALQQEHPRGKEKFPSPRREIGLQKKEARLRRAAPKRYALPFGKGANRGPHQDRDGGADNVAARAPRPGVAGSPARPQDSALAKNRLDFYHPRR